MATTFNVLYLGDFADLDPTEGRQTRWGYVENYEVENAESLVGMTFGGTDAPLQDSYAEFSKISTQDGIYRTDNGGRSGTRYDEFMITELDGTQTIMQMDSTVVYSATITYMNGETAQITAVVFQSRTGETYLAPEFSENDDQTWLEYRGIRSVTLDALEMGSSSGLVEDRQTFEFVTCFTKGTLIDTIHGPRPIETLRAGDMIWTLDEGYRPLRWVGCKDVAADGDLAPIRFLAGSLGSHGEILVSPNHRMYLQGAAVSLHFGEDDALAPAKHLVNGKDIQVIPHERVTYYHIMFDRHQIVRANGLLTESFHPNDYAMTCLTDEGRAEILALFPELAEAPATYGATARYVMKRHEVAAILRDVVAPASWKDDGFALAS